MKISHIAAVSLAAAMTISGASGAFGKAHDAGVADGEPGMNAADAGQTGGVRGEAVSSFVTGDDFAPQDLGADNADGKGNSDGDGGPGKGKKDRP